MDRLLYAISAPAPLVLAALGIAGAVLAGSLWPLAGLGVAAVLAWRRAASPGARLVAELREAGLAGAGLGRTLDRLRRDLGRTLARPGAARFGIRALAQLDALQGKLIGFRAILGERFSPTELTFGRYYGAAQQVFLSVIGRLAEVVTRLRTVESVDPAMLEARARQLERSGVEAPAQARELESLRSRLALHGQAMAEVEELLAANDEALNGLLEASQSLARIRTREAPAALDADSALTELRSLAARSERYAVGASRIAH